MERVIAAAMHELVEKACEPEQIAQLLAPSSDCDLASMREVRLPDGRILTLVVALGFEDGAVGDLKSYAGFTLQ